MRKDRTFCRHWKGKNVTLQGYRGSACPQQILSCSLSLAEGLLARSVHKQAMCHQSNFLLHTTTSRLSAAGEIVQAEDQREGVCNEKAEKSRDGQTRPGEFRAIQCNKQTSSIEAQRAFVCLQVALKHPEWYLGFIQMCCRLTMYVLKGMCWLRCTTPMLSSCTTPFRYNALQQVNGQHTAHLVRKQEASCPYIQCSLRSLCCIALQDEQWLYLVMEYLPGGDVMVGL